MKLGITLSIVYLLFTNTLWSQTQNNKYYCILKQDCKTYEDANLNSKVTSSQKKGTKIFILGKKGDFVKTSDNQFIHKDFIKISENLTYRVDSQIEVMNNDFKTKMKAKNTEGLNLNNGSRDFIELPKRDTVKFENLKF